MKKKLLSFAIVICILICLIVFSGCVGFLDEFAKLNYHYKDMSFRSFRVTENDPDEFKAFERYYAAGYISLKSKTLQHIPMAVDGDPVLQLGFPTDLMSGGFFIKMPELETLYIPSTILRIDRLDSVYVEEHAENFKAFYCGTVVNLSELARFGVKDKCYIPAEKYEEFKNAWITDRADRGSADVNLFKANIKYRLNADDMNDYYYVDYVENGTNIVNIPPDPERVGYKFDGWYIEKECYTKWSFNSNPILTATESNADGEFSLYAKWVKK